MLVTLMTFSGFAQASDNEEAEPDSVSVGLGFGVIGPSMGVLGRSSFFFSSPGVNVPIQLSEHFRLEPGLSFSWSQSEDEHSDSASGTDSSGYSLSAGLGAYYTGSHRPVSIFVGPRVSYGSGFYQFDGSDGFETKSGSVTVDGVFGLEFWAAPSIAFGGETYLGYGYSWTEWGTMGAPLSGSELTGSTNHRVSAGGGIFLRWFI